MNHIEERLYEEFPDCIYLNAEQFKGALELYRMLLKKRDVLIKTNGEAVSDAVEFAEWKKDYRWLKSIRKWVSDKDDLLTTQELYDNFKMTTQTYKTSNNE